MDKFLAARRIVANAPVEIRYNDRYKGGALTVTRNILTGENTYYIRISQRGIGQMFGRTTIMLYRTLFHELAHYTGAKMYLNRALVSMVETKRISKQSHFVRDIAAIEEIIADLTAFSVLNALGLADEALKDSVSDYIKEYKRRTIKIDWREVRHEVRKATKLILSWAPQS